MNAGMGRLVIWPDRCRGCRSCQLACSLRRTGEFNPGRSCIELERDLATEKTAPMIRALSCDLCNGEPACVGACTYGALTFESLPWIEVRGEVASDPDSGRARKE